MARMTQLVKDYVLLEGACAAGIATAETLQGGPPSTDLSYVLPNAKSAICFALKLDQSLIPLYLSKKDRLSHETDNFRTNFLASGIALGLAKYLEQKGHRSVPIAANEVYRPETPRGRLDMMPDISLRYLAVRSGVASFGLSGNVLRRDAGAGIILGAVVTTAELDPTDPLPEEENYCDGCRLCMASCASQMMDPEQKTDVTLGGRTFSYSKRRNYLRCEFVCGGFTGLHPSGKWSTWSPGRFMIPDREEDFLKALASSVEAYNRRPPMKGGHLHVLMDSKLYMTCANCQLVCVPDKEERKRRHRMLVESGCVVQNPDGSLEALPPEEAARRLARMNLETRSLYERV